MANLGASSSSASALRLSEAYVKSTCEKQIVDPPDDKATVRGDELKVRCRVLCSAFLPGHNALRPAPRGQAVVSRP